LEDWRVKIRYEKEGSIKKKKLKIRVYSLGFSVFLNSGGNGNEMGGYENNDYLPEACQINLDYGGKNTFTFQALKNINHR
jgi:hypothetical protein